MGVPTCAEVSRRYQRGGSFSSKAKRAASLIIGGVRYAFARPKTKKMIRNLGRDALQGVSYRPRRRRKRRRRRRRV